MMKILLMMTGGTICSQANEKGQFAANTAAATPELVAHLRREGIENAEFDILPVFNILSENMTFSRLNQLLRAFRDNRERIEASDGVILTHGTDTLAYTSSLLALALAGYTDKPVFLVSSNLPLSDLDANGHENFRTAVKLIEKGFGGGVYVPYRNSDGVTYLHHGAHLRQCANFTSDFFSLDMQPVAAAKSYAVLTDASILEQLARLEECVLKLSPYVGMDYSCIALPERIRAVLHGTYHSATACAEREKVGQAYSSHSLFYLVKRCRMNQIDVFLTPLRTAQRETMIGSYQTTAELLKSGIQPIFSLTEETAYMKLALAYSLGYEKEEVGLFLSRDLASETLEY